MKQATVAVLLFFFALSALASRQHLAPLAVAEDASQRIQGEYLVLLRDGLTRPLFEMQVVMMKSALAAAADGSELKRTYAIGDSFFALHLKLTPASLEKIRAHPYVALVEENQAAHANQVCNQQNDVIWNLGRIDTHDIDLVDDNYKYSHAGQDVNVYIIDTGVLTTHVEFGGRAEWGTSFADDGVDDKDCNGHGTHVAGTVGGTTVGVARGVTLIAVKVLGCDGSGTAAGVISGIQWTAENARKRGRKSVANMSLGGGYSSVENRAVAAVVDAGVPFAVAAGNEDQNACNVSPASEAKAITVGATYFTGSLGSGQDIRASFSNWGTCVDVLAPGQAIKSAWIGSNSAYNTISGTSMASPHVCGVAALIFGAHPSYSATQVKSKILADSTSNAIDLKCTKSGCSSTPNKLLYTAPC